MNFVADESVDAPIFQLLRKSGYNVFAIVEKTAGIPDERVLEIAEQNKSILITQDKDFGELVFRLRKTHFGVILIRLAGMPPNRKAELTINAIQQHLQDLPRAFTVVYKDYVKIRKGQ